MRVFQLTQADIDKLLLVIDQNPEQSGGGSHHMGDDDRRVYHEAHQFYNHRIRRWIDEVTK